MGTSVAIRGGRRVLATVNLATAADPIDALRLALLAVAESGEAVTHLEISEGKVTDNGYDHEG